MSRRRHLTSLYGAAAVAVAVTAMVLGGCGGSDNSVGGSGSASTSTSPATSGGGNAVKLSETEFKIDPANPSVKKTGTVTFTATNNGQITHALEVEGPGEEKKTGNIEPGKSATLKVDISKPGTYEFYCPIDGHKQSGMKGEIKVGS
jgi:uncharacterized cupredoxin-like copper-binding protein